MKPDTREQPPPSCFDAWLLLYYVIVKKTRVKVWPVREHTLRHPISGFRFQSRRTTTTVKYRHGGTCRKIEFRWICDDGTVGAWFERIGDCYRNAKINKFAKQGEDLKCL